MNQCSACGNALSTNVKFCSECGATTTAQDAPAPEATGKGHKKLFIGAALAVVLLGGGIAFAAGGSGGLTAYETCMENNKNDPTLTVEDKADLCRLETSDSGGTDTEGNSEQPKTCLQWKTNYRQELVYDGGTNMFGNENSHWEQVPTGQTCVRFSGSESSDPAPSAYETCAARNPNVNDRQALCGTKP